MYIDVTRLTKLIDSDEGNRLKVYRDFKGILSIARGRNLESVGLRPSESDFLFHNDVEDIMQQLTVALPWIDTLNSVRQTALVDMGFMGVPKLLGFRNMLTALQLGQWAAAYHECLDSKWAK